MITLLTVCRCPSALDALAQALGQIEPLAAHSVVVDPLPFIENGVHLYRWLSVAGEGLPYPDSILNDDGSSAPTVRRAVGGYVSPDGTDGRWAVLALDASAHMLEEAADLLTSAVDPDWGAHAD